MKKPEIRRLILELAYVCLHTNINLDQENAEWNIEFDKFDEALERIVHQINAAVYSHSAAVNDLGSGNAIEVEADTSHRKLTRADYVEPYDWHQCLQNKKEL